MKLSDIIEENESPKEEMPRYIISATQEYFNRLRELLDRNDEASPLIWDLVRSLVTNSEAQK